MLFLNIYISLGVVFLKERQKKKKGVLKSYLNRNTFNEEKTIIFLLLFLQSNEPVPPVTAQKPESKTDQFHSFTIMICKPLFQKASIYSISSQPKIK